MDDLIKRDDAPERIWTASTNGKCHVGFDTPSLDYKNEYIRADLTDPAAIREAALREALATVQWLKDEFEALGSPTAGRVLAHAMERIEALIGEKK